MRQWREFISGPVDAAAKVVSAPVLIVIDALDESGDARSREDILRVLASCYGRRYLGCTHNLCTSFHSRIYMSQYH